MGEAANSYQGLPIRFLFGFVGLWVVMRPLVFDLSGQEEGIPPYRAFALYQPKNEVAAEAPISEEVAAPSLAQPVVQPPVRLLRELDFDSMKMVARDKGVPMPASPTRSLSKDKAQWADAITPALPVAPAALAAMPKQDVLPVQVSPQPSDNRSAPSIDRLSASAWVLWRDGSTDTGTKTNVVSPRYGASQAGVRLAYRVDGNGRVELYGRATAALQSRGKDVAAGVAVKPLRGANVALAAEYRQALDHNARSGPALMTYGGFGPSNLGQGWTAEGYGQAGVVGVREAVAFADGSVRVKRKIAAVGAVPVSMGAGAWAGAQDDSARLDIGPTVDFDLTALAKSPLRASIDWRQRVAGKAVPDSGVAVTIATDF